MNRYKKSGRPTDSEMFWGAVEELAGWVLGSGAVVSISALISWCIAYTVSEFARETEALEIVIRFIQMVMATIPALVLLIGSAIALVGKGSRVAATLGTLTTTAVVSAQVAVLWVIFEVVVRLVER